MLKAFAAILFFAFSVQCFQKGLIILSYFTNKAVFTKNCENKSRPSLNCHGKCVMMKKLMAEEKKQQKNPELKLENKVEVYEPSLPHLPQTLHKATPATLYVASSIGSVADCLSDVFHPPAV